MWAFLAAKIRLPWTCSNAVVILVCDLHRQAIGRTDPSRFVSKSTVPNLFHSPAAHLSSPPTNTASRAPCVPSALQAENDRVGLLHTLATLEEHPESVPINALVPVDGTPLADEGRADAPDIWDMGRMIATARVVMPRTMVRLSAGRLSFSESEQVSAMDRVWRHVDLLSLEFYHRVVPMWTRAFVSGARTLHTEVRARDAELEMGEAYKRERIEIET